MATDASIPVSTEENLIESIHFLKGRVEMVSFKQFQCGITLDNGTYLSEIYFDEEMADILAASLREDVFVIGIAASDSQTQELKRFDIKIAVVLDEDTSPDQLDSLYREYLSEHDTANELKEGWKDILRGDTLSLEEFLESVNAD